MSDPKVAPEAAMINLLQAQLDAGVLPNARELMRFDPADLDKLVASVGDPDWTVESKAIDKQMGVSKVGKARLLAIARRTNLSPTRALDAAITALYNQTQNMLIPSTDEIAAQLAEGRTPGIHNAASGSHRDA